MTPPDRGNLDEGAKPPVHIVPRPETIPSLYDHIPFVRVDRNGRPRLVRRFVWGLAGLIAGFLLGKLPPLTSFDEDSASKTPTAAQQSAVPPALQLTTTLDLPAGQ